MTRGIGMIFQKIAVLHLKSDQLKECFTMVTISKKEDKDYEHRSVQKNQPSLSFKKVNSTCVGAQSSFVAPILISRHVRRCMVPMVGWMETVLFVSDIYVHQKYVKIP